MDHPTKKQKVVETTSCKDEVLFNSDTLSKIISYLPSVDVLNLALTCKRFGISTNDERSLIEDSAHITVQDFASDEQLAALPHYEGDSKLADYHYLQLLRAPLAFDQLVGDIAYVNSGDKSCVQHFHRVTGIDGTWATALSNNILRTGKHYSSFKLCNYMNYSFLGVMRPGQVHENARGIPDEEEFYQHFSRNIRRGEGNNMNNSIQCCLYITHTGDCDTSRWEEPDDDIDQWDGMETMSSGDEVGMLLDLHEGTLSVYKNGRKLGVMRKGLAGPFCWVASLHRGMKVTIKRGTIPPS